MFVPANLKLNKFRQVNIPTLRQYVQRYGLLNVPQNAYSGDASLFDGRKTDILSRLDAIDRYHQHQESVLALKAEDAPAPPAE